MQHRFLNLILVASGRQWIEVIFRGSVTACDFLADVDPLMTWYVCSVGMYAWIGNHALLNIDAL